MAPSNFPLKVLPPVYRASFGMWRWCKLTEICAVIPGLVKVAEIRYNPTPEELVFHFAALTRLTRLPEHLVKEEADKRKKKIFRYSKDGMSLWGTEVPMASPMPPYEPFELQIGVPYPPGLLVPEGWAIDTLNAILQGAVAAADWGGNLVGFRPRNDHRSLISLGGRRDSLTVGKVPECVR